MRCIYPIVIIR